MGDHEKAIAAYERRFRRSGLPLFVEGPSAATTVFNRALPLLVVVLVVEVLGAIPLGWSTAASLVAVLGGLALVLTGYALANLVRGRPLRARPDRAGRVELVLFVVAPAAVTLAVGGPVADALAVGAGNVALLLLLYAVLGYGLVATIWWSLRRMAGELGPSLSLLIRTLPVLLVFSLVLFVNTEMWQVFSRLSGPNTRAVTWTFIVLVVLFVALRIPGEVAQVELAADGAGPPLQRRQRVNIGVTLAVVQLVQVLVVSLGVFGFFLWFGALTTDPSIYESWSVAPGGFAETARLGNVEVYLTDALVDVARGIASVTGLYFAIQTSIDASYRAQFATGASDELRSVFQARAEYLALRASGGRADG